MRTTDLSITATTGRAFVPFLRRTLRKIATQHPAPAILSFALVGDQTMSRLHAHFLDIAGPTDVLTFELDHDKGGRVTNGEIIVCVPEARRQAKMHSTKVEHELLLYCLHGILHLTGYDDLDEAGHRKMHAAEDRILTAIGIGPLFRPISLPTRPATMKATSNRPQKSKRRLKR